MRKRKLKKGQCKDIEKISIQFENCEEFTFTKKELSNLFLNHIRKNISICINAVIEDYEAEDVWIVIPIGIANRKVKAFGFMEPESLIDRVGLSKDKPIRDITHIYLYYNTGEEECISCVWHGDNDFDNPAQVCKIEEGKYLTISISERNVKEYNFGA